MKFEIEGVGYQELKEHLDDLVMSHDLRTYRLVKVSGSLPGYWLELTVNKRQWLKTWRDTGNKIEDSKDSLEKSLTEELQGIGHGGVKVRLVNDPHLKGVGMSRKGHRKLASGEAS
jgi:hypothetical protein